MYTLKSIAQRGSMLGAAVALVAAAVVPSAAVFADALNPLTERSLLLSSSAPGYIDTDGSNYSTGTPNPAAGGNTPATYAPAGSGPNGKKTGETFSFKVSTDSTTRAIKAFTLQYCTSAAGHCQAPGDNTGDARVGAPTARGADTSSTSDFNVTSGAAWTQGAGAGQFQVYVGNSNTPAPSSDWVMTTVNKENTEHSGPLTGKNNYVTLASPTGVTPAAGERVRIVFTASESSYITNPGHGSFFVKMNTYDSETPADHVPMGLHNIDGGVTVANVMTDSIHITTKVLETMSFSVGTKNRDTMDIGTGQTHGKCDPIQVENNNRLNLGDPDAEYSLRTDKSFDTHSYWRLSSNSSGGATVYYSGNTLANTVGDEIKDVTTETASTPGTEQFGLGFVDAGLDTKDDGTGNETAGNPDNGVGTWAAGSAGAHQIRSFPFKTLSSQTTGDYATLAAQSASTAYDEATGSLYEVVGPSVNPGTAKFKFLKTSLTVPEPIAQQNEQVISCATAKMRYVANIGADTPAGVYTTKVNYLAAPQY